MASRPAGGVRGGQVTRQWQVLVLLRRRPYTMVQLARELGYSHRTIRRDLQALEAVPFPLIQDGPYWGLMDITEWPRGETVPVRVRA